MGPLLVVFDQPGIRDLLHLLDRFEDVGIEDLGPIGPVKTLDEGVLVGLPRLDETELDLSLLGPADKVMARELAPVVEYRAE